jgi:hypothetical protein
MFTGDGDCHTAKHSPSRLGLEQHPLRAICWLSTAKACAASRPHTVCISIFPIGTKSACAYKLLIFTHPSSSAAHPWLDPPPPSIVEPCLNPHVQWTPPWQPPGIFYILYSSSNQHKALHTMTSAPPNGQSCDRHLFPSTAADTALWITSHPSNRPIHVESVHRWCELLGSGFIVLKHDVWRHSWATTWLPADCITSSETAAPETRLFITHSFRRRCSSIEHGCMTCIPLLIVTAAM